VHIGYSTLQTFVTAKEGPIFPRAHGKIRQTFDFKVQDGSM
jgi:hypothetical protein